MVFTEIFQKIVEYNTLFVFLKLNNLTLPIYSYQISNINQSLSSSHLFPLQFIIQRGSAPSRSEGEGERKGGGGYQ